MRQRTDALARDARLRASVTDDAGDASATDAATDTADNRHRTGGVAPFASDSDAAQWSHQPHPAFAGTKKEHIMLTLTLPKTLATLACAVAALATTSVAQAGAGVPQK